MKVDISVATTVEFLVLSQPGKPADPTVPGVPGEPRCPGKQMQRPQWKDNHLKNLNVKKGSMLVVIVQVIFEQLSSVKKH